MQLSDYKLFLRFSFSMLGCLVFLMRGYVARAHGIVEDSTRKVTESGNLSVIPLPVFGYEPETRGYAGGVILFTFRVSTDSTTRLSNADLELNYTQNRQSIVDLDWQIYSGGNKWFTQGIIEYKNFPQYHYGIGNSTPKSNREFFESRFVNLDFIAVRRIKNNLYSGLSMQWMNMYKLEGSAGSTIEQGTLYGAQGGVSTGIGCYFARDSRVNILTPERGELLSLDWRFFPKALGDYSFSVFRADARKYIDLGNQKRYQVLALQLCAGFRTGQPPFYLTGLLGSSSAMRGYYQGRFRDRQIISTQIEWRRHVFWRFAGVLFAGCGDVAWQFRDFRWNQLKPTFGTGVRFLVDKKENTYLRADLAFGKQTSGIYFSFGEAF